MTKKYKDKNCELCNENFSPTSGMQKVCSDCKILLRRKTERKRDRAKRKKYNRACEACSKDFVTTDSRRKFCGSWECEKFRRRKNSIKIEQKRVGTRTKEKKQYYKENLQDILDSKKVYYKEVLHSDREVKDGWDSLIEIGDYIESILHGNTLILRKDRSLISPYELDIYIPSKKVAIEYCGLYRHSELSGGKSRRYHYEKMMACFEKDVRLITIFEDEYLKRPKVVLSRIANALGASPRRIFARKCQLVQLPKSTSLDFLNQHHLQGKGSSKTGWGLFYEGEIVQVLTVGNLARAHTAGGKKTLEMKRFASVPGVSVVGGASKLFSAARKYALEDNFEAIKSYCDMRFANIFRPVYESLGFELQTYTKYTPHYLKEGVRVRNQGLRKTPSERLTGLTEWELRKAQGYDRIWDCGHRTYLYLLDKDG